MSIVLNWTLKIFHFMTDWDDFATGTGSSLKAHDAFDEHQS